MASHAALTALVNVLFGVGLGVTGDSLGIDDGLTVISVSGYLYGMDQRPAQGTVPVIIVPSVLIGFQHYHQRHPVCLCSVALTYMFPMAVAYVTTRFAVGFDTHLLYMAFVVSLIMLTLYFAPQSKEKPRAGDTVHVAPRAMSAAALPPIGIASEAMSGIFTVGGGLVVVPAPVTFSGMPRTYVQGMALALVVPGSLIALTTYAYVGHVDWGTGTPLAVGDIASVPWGAALVYRLSVRRLWLAFCTVLLGTALMILLARLA